MEDGHQVRCFSAIRTHQSFFLVRINIRMLTGNYRTRLLLQAFAISQTDGRSATGPVSTAICGLSFSPPKGVL